MIGRVEIAGAGIAGLTAGLAFARKGWRVRVHEQADDLHVAAAGIHIWENGLRVLDALGVLHQATWDALPAWRHERRDRGEAFASVRLRPNFRLYLPPHETLLAALYDALIAEGGQVEFGSRAIAADADGSLYFAGGGRARADLIVAADGAGSTIRDGLGLLRGRQASGQLICRTLIPSAEGQLRSEAGRTHCEHLSGPYRLLYAPCTEDTACIELTAPAGDPRGGDAGINRDFWCRRFPHLAAIIERLPDDARAAPVTTVRARAWSKDRVALVGDAATGQPPFLGQGGGCALMSAYVLAEAIDRAEDLATGLAEWRRRQRRFTEWTQRVACWYGRLALLPPPVRFAALRSLAANEALQAATLYAAAHRDPTAPSAWRRPEDLPVPIPIFH